jgi:hypothetical protein
MELYEIAAVVRLAPTLGRNVTYEPHAQSTHFRYVQFVLCLCVAIIKYHFQSSKQILIFMSFNVYLHSIMLLQII